MTMTTDESLSVHGYSGFGTRKEEELYDQVAGSLLRLLSMRLALFFSNVKEGNYINSYSKQQAANDRQLKDAIKKHYRKLLQLEQNKYTSFRFSESVGDLAQLLGVNAFQQHHDGDGLSNRRSSHSTTDDQIEVDRVDASSHLSTFTKGQDSRSERSRLLAPGSKASRAESHRTSKEVKAKRKPKEKKPCSHTNINMDDFADFLPEREQKAIQMHLAKPEINKMLDVRNETTPYSPEPEVPKPVDNLTYLADIGSNTIDLVGEPMFKDFVVARKDLSASPVPIVSPPPNPAKTKSPDLPRHRMAAEYAMRTIQPARRALNGAIISPVPTKSVAIQHSPPNDVSVQASLSDQMQILMSQERDRKKTYVQLKKSPRQSGNFNELSMSGTDVISLELGRRSMTKRNNMDSKPGNTLPVLGNQRTMMGLQQNDLVTDSLSRTQKYHEIHQTRQGNLTTLQLEKSNMTQPAFTGHRFGQRKSTIDGKSDQKVMNRIPPISRNNGGDGIPAKRPSETSKVHEKPTDGQDPDEVIVQAINPNVLLQDKGRRKSDLPDQSPKAINPTPGGASPKGTKQLFQQQRNSRIYDMPTGQQRASHSRGNSGEINDKGKPGSIEVTPVVNKIVDQSTNKVVMSPAVYVNLESGSKKRRMVKNAFAQANKAKALERAAAEQEAAKPQAIDQRVPASVLARSSQKSKLSTIQASHGSKRTVRKSTERSPRASSKHAISTGGQQIATSSSKPVNDDLDPVTTN